MKIRSARGDTTMMGKYKYMDKPSYPEIISQKILSYFTTVFHLNKFSAEFAQFDRDVANCLLGSDKQTKDWVWKIRVAKR